MAQSYSKNWVYEQNEMAAVQLDKQAYGRGSQIWITYWPPYQRSQQNLLLNLWFTKILCYARLMLWLEALNIPTDMWWGIYALYKSVSRKVQSPNGLSEAVISTSPSKTRMPHYHHRDKDVRRLIVLNRCKQRASLRTMSPSFAS